MLQIAIFASGAGSNAKKIIEYFNHAAKSDQSARVSLIVCNKPGAGVIDIALKEGIPTLIIEKEKFFRGDGYAPELSEKGIDLIVLAGFLWKIPLTLIRAFPNRIINIHPALLPAYGGKGMYGEHVHRAVIQNKEVRSGISIHYVDEVYDHGDIIFQEYCTVSENDSPASLADRIHLLEHAHYPRVIGEVVKKLNN